MAAPATESASNVVCRRADVEDIDAILALIADDSHGYRQRWGHFNLETLIDTCYLSIVALAVGGEESSDAPPIVGFAAFTDSPSGSELGAGLSTEEWFAWASASHAMEDAQAATSMWLALLVADERAGYGADVVDQVLRTAFTTLPDMDHVVACPPVSVGLFSPLDEGEAFKLIPVLNQDALEAMDPKFLMRSSAVLVAQRTNFIPTLRVRRAAVEDHDDLVPIFNSQSEVLTEQYGEFFLAELIEAQDEVHKALVAEVDGTAVGLMAVSSRVDLGLLGSCFDLTAYNNLVKQSAAEEEASARNERALCRTRRDWLTQLEANSSKLAAIFDSIASSADDAVSVSKLRAALDSNGIEWGFENLMGAQDTASDPKPSGLGLGGCLVAELGLARQEAISRAELDGLIEAYTTSRFRRYRRRRLAAWYNRQDGRKFVLDEFDALESDSAFSVPANQRSASGAEDAGTLESKAGDSAGAGAGAGAGGAAKAEAGSAKRANGPADKGEDGGEQEEDEEEEAQEMVPAVSVVDLASALSARVAATGMDYVGADGEPASLGDDLLDEFHDLVGESAWTTVRKAVPEPEPADDAGSANGLEGGEGADSSSTPPGGKEDPGADEDGERKAEGKEVDDQDGGALVEAQPSGPASVVVTRQQVIQSLNAFEEALMDDASVRVAVSGGPRVGKKTAAAAIASRLGVPAVLVMTEVQEAKDAADKAAADAAASAEAAAIAGAAAAAAGEGEDGDGSLDGGKGDEEDEDGDAESKEEEFDEAAAAWGIWAPVMSRITGDDCADGFVLADLPTDLDQMFELLEHLRAAHVQPNLEISLQASVETILERYSGDDAAYAKQTAAYKRFVSVRDGHKTRPGWAPRGGSLVIDATTASPDDIAETVHKIALRRELCRDTEAEADEEAAAAAAALDAAPGDAEPNAFSITLFCVDDTFDSRSQDFLRHAFVTFPDRDYCVLTLPHASSETALLSKFSLAAPKPDSTFEHVLYVVHRASLLTPAALCVRRATPFDRAAILSLVDSLPTGPSLLSAVAAAEDHLGKDPSKSPTFAVVAEVASQVVGVVVMSAQDASAGNVNALREAFELDLYLPPATLVGTGESDSPGTVAVLTHFAVNPIFLASSRDIVRNCLRLYGNRHTALYRLLPFETDGATPTVVDDLVQVAPRALPELRPGELPVVFTASGAPKQLTEAQYAHALESGADSASNPRALDHALFFLTRKLCSEPKLRVNSRVVVVGSSDTSVSFLQTLMMVPYLDFTSLTLVSPGGLPPLEEELDELLAGNLPWLPKPEFSGFDLARLVMQARVRVVDSRVVSIDREAKVVSLPDGAVVPYDYLMLAAGLSEPTAHRIGFDCPEDAPENVHFLTHHGAVPAVDAATRRLAIGGGEGAAAGGRRDILVYGSGLEALTATAAIIDRGISPGRIVLARSCAAAACPGLHLPSDSETSAALQARTMATITSLGVEVLAETTLTAVEETGSGGDVAAKLTTPSGIEERTFALVVCGDTRNVDWQFFKAVNDCGLVYDGRLVVDHQFKTTDASILASGTVTKFSRRYRAKRTLEHHNSREMGAAVAGTVLSLVDPLRSPDTPFDGTDTLGSLSATGGGADTFPPRKGRSTLPRLDRPRPFFGVLPGGLHFLHVSLAEVDLGDVGGDMVTRARPTDSKEDDDSEEKTCRLVLDRYGRLASLTFLGPGPIEPDNLAGLVGRHEAYLNAVGRDFAAGRVSDFISFFRGDWAGALYHDRFQSLCEELRASTISDEELHSLFKSISDAAKAGEHDKELTLKRIQGVGVSGVNLAPSTRRSIEVAVIEHLRTHGALLSMYFLPGHNLAK